MNESAGEVGGQGGQTISLEEVKLAAKVTVSAKITPVERDALRLISNKCGVSTSYLIRAAIRALLKEIAEQRPAVLGEELAGIIRSLDDLRVTC